MALDDLKTTTENKKEFFDYSNMNAEETGKLFEQEKGKESEGIKNYQNEIFNTLSEDQRNLATPENIETESLNYKFLQENPLIDALVDKNKFKIDKKNKSISFDIIFKKGGKPYYYGIEITKKGLVVNGEIDTEFLDGLDDQEYSNKNSKQIFQQMINRFSTSKVLGNEDNKADYLPGIEKRLKDANTVFDAFFK